MKKQLLTGILSAGILTIGSSISSGSAYAFDLNDGCSPIATFASATSSSPLNCQFIENPFSDAANDVADSSTVLSTKNKINVNNVNKNIADGIESFFDTDTWEFVTRGNSDPASAGTNEAGTVSYSTSSYSKLMAIIKDGKDSTLVGYLLDPNAGNVTFNWDANTDVWSNITGKKKAISHVSIYGVEGAPIPTPAVIPGLIGMGVAAMRKKKQSDDELQEV